VSRIYLIKSNQKNEISSSFFRYVQFLIKYHLFILFCAVIMTSICIGFLIYKRDQINNEHLLRVNKNFFFFVLNFSNKKKIFRVFKYMEQNHPMNIEN